MHLTQALTSSEERALLVADETGDVSEEAKSAVLKAICHFAAKQKRLDISLADFLTALNEGLTNKGDQLLTKTLAVLTRYLSSWGVMAILVFSLVMLIDKGVGAAQKFFAWVKGLSAVISPIAGLRTAAASVFLDESSNADPAQSIAVIATVVSAEVPLFGTLLALAPKLSAQDVDYRMPGVGEHVRRDVAYDEDLNDEALDHAADVFAAAVRAGADPEQIKHHLAGRAAYDESESNRLEDVAYDAFEQVGMA